MEIYSPRWPSLCLPYLLLLFLELRRARGARARAREPARSHIIAILPRAKTNQKVGAEARFDLVNRGIARILGEIVRESSGRFRMLSRR